MCGIVGYLGRQSVVPIILDGLKSLEYRGYDSSGVAFLDEHTADLVVYKASGKLQNLRNLLPSQVLESHTDKPHVGMGHTRWATHGAPTNENAHPHVSASGKIALIHNGIIENYSELRDELMKKGYAFLSKTDTECVVHLIEEIAKTEPDFLKVLQRVTERLVGAYAMVVLHRDHPDRLYGVRHHAPLVVGLGDDETLLGSDVVALAQYARQVAYLRDGEIVELSPDGFRIVNFTGDAVQPKLETLSGNAMILDKGGFKHYMLKEIHEQPDVVRQSLSSRLLTPEDPIALLDDPSALDPANIDRIVIVGCGTSFHAGQVGKYFIEGLARIPVEVSPAGEFRYSNPILDQRTLIIAISQSGETADTLAAIRQGHKSRSKIISVTNREDSTIAREADWVLPVRAGLEVSVCATKSFTAQVCVLYLIGLALAERSEHAPPVLLTELKTALQRIPAQIEQMLHAAEPLQKLARKYGHAHDMIFIARGINFPVAMEGALKLKEISYIHAEGYSAAELKHGPIALLAPGMPVISLLAPGVVYDKMISNCQEAKAREASLIAINCGPMPEGVEDTFDDILMVPETHELLSPLLTSIPLQLLAYYIAEYLGKDVDQPRNLAKSVTVE